MTYPETLYTAIASAAAGGMVFCLLSVPAAAVFHRSIQRWRLSAFCVLLSITIASSAFLLICTSFSIEHLKNFSAVLWCSAFALIGILGTAFYRILIPSGAALYIMLALFSYHAMRIRFPVPGRLVSVSVCRGTFTSGAATGVLLPDKSGVPCIPLDVCTLPPELLVPIPRTWYAFHGTGSGIVNLPDKGNFLHRAAAGYVSYAAGRVSVVYIPVPSGADTAAIYTLDCSFEHPALVRVL
jgi:hypothetical protein